MAAPEKKVMPSKSTVDIGALTEKWYELRQVPREDEEGQRELRQVLARLRRLNHDDKHPDCVMVELTVPPHPLGTHYTIWNASRKYIYRGRVVVPTCVARQLLSMIDSAQRVDAERLREKRLSRNLGEITPGQAAAFAASDA